MRYFYTIVLLGFLVGCGNESYYEKKEKVRLLNTDETNTTVSQKDVERAPVEKENNSSEAEMEEKVLETPHEKVLPIETEAIEENREVLEQTPLMTQVENNTSNPEVNLSTVTPPSIEASFDEKMTEKGFTLESELKKIEMDQKSAVIANEKEIALAKLENEKLSVQQQAAMEQKKAELEALNRKELELAKLESAKVVSLRENELSKEKSLYDKEVALAKLETQKSISEKEQKIAESKVSSDKELALAKLEVEKEQKYKDLELYKMIMAVVAGLVILILLIVYMIHRRNKKIELQLHEDELMHQKYMEASKQHNENLKKMLDIVTDEKMDKGIKKDIVRLLKDQGKQSDLIEHKK